MLCLLNNNQWFTAFICLFRKEKKQNTVCWDCMAFIFQKVNFSSKPLRFYTVTVNIYRSGQKNPIYCLYIILLRVVWETRTNTSSDQGKVGYTLATRPVHPKATIQSSVLKKIHCCKVYALFSSVCHLVGYCYSVVERNYCLAGKLWICTRIQLCQSIEIHCIHINK